MITGDDLIKQSPDASSVKQYLRLPLYIKENLTCHCKRNYFEGTKAYPKPFDIHSYCLTCLLPHVFCVQWVVQVCDGCEQYFIPQLKDFRNEWRRGQSAIPYPLCGRCGDSTTSGAEVRTGITRSGFRFS